MLELETDTEGYTRRRCTNCITTEDDTASTGQRSACHITDTVCNQYTVCIGKKADTVLLHHTAVRYRVCSYAILVLYNSTICSATI